MISDSLSKALKIVKQDAMAAIDGRLDFLAPLRGKHLFVSGGTGFLGTWLLEICSVLNQDFAFGTHITVYSRNSMAFAKRWPHIGRQSWIRFLDGDIRNLSELPRDVNFVIHAAATTDRRHFSTHPTAVAETNIFGTARILKASLWLENIEKFTLLSSGLIYGTQHWDHERIAEDYLGQLKCNDVMAVYAESKRAAETFAQAAISESKLPVVILRPFAFVGPFQSLELSWAVTDFIRDSLNGGPVRIMGDGLTVRSILYGSDFAYAVLAATASAKARAIYNLGSPEPVDLKNLATMITQNFLPSPEIQTKVGQVGHDRTRLVPNTKTIERDLQFRVTVPLNLAIQKTIEWHRLLRS
jgi:nucleoside-diphosphate-sugar epimerase